MLLPPENVRALFVEAGWRPGRRVLVSGLAGLDHPGAAILEAFDGLLVGSPPLTEAVTVARDNVTFGPVEERGDLVAAWEACLRTRLIGVGTAQDGYEEVWVSAAGFWFLNSTVAEGFALAGESFAEAMECSLRRSRRVRPMLLPGETSVELYGQTYGREHPDLFRAWQDRPL